MRVSAAGLRDAVLGELLGPREGAGPLRARRAERGAGGLQARRKREWAAMRSGLGLGFSTGLGPFLFLSPFYISFSNITQTN